MPPFGTRETLCATRIRTGLPKLPLIDAVENLILGSNLADDFTEKR